VVAGSENTIYSVSIRFFNSLIHRKGTGVRRQFRRFSAAESQLFRSLLHTLCTPHPQNIRGFSALDCTTFPQAFRSALACSFPQQFRALSGVFKQTRPQENGRKQGGGQKLRKSVPPNTGAASSARRSAADVPRATEFGQVAAGQKR
jgi:hypothetical protein